MVIVSGTWAPVDPQEPSKGPASSDQLYPDIDMLPSDMTMSTDIQVAFSFVSALDICLTSFGNARTVGARNADQADYGPLNPASLRLELSVILGIEQITGETLRNFR
ncbi:unnamed protein product [Prunus armeniaca]